MRILAVRLMRLRVLLFKIILYRHIKKSYFLRLPQACLSPKKDIGNKLFSLSLERLCRNEGIDGNVILNSFQDLMNSANYEIPK